jgi:nitroreductase
MELYEAMRTTPATRAFTAEPVADEVLYRMLDNARFAPSGGNRQGQRVIVVRDPETRRALRAIYLESWRLYQAEMPAHEPTPPSPSPRPNQVNDRFAEGLDAIPVHLIVCVRLAALAILDRDLDRQSLTGGGSIYPFVQNLLLAARNEGLGAAMTTMVIRYEPRVRELLGIPPEYAIAAHVLVGHPDPEHVVTKLRRIPVNELARLETFEGAPFEKP